MKRLFCIALCALLLLSLACASASNALTSTAPEVTATAAPTPEPTPEPLGLAPEDLLEMEYNPFFDMQFIGGYTIYGARFDCGDPNKGTMDAYTLYLTAEGDPYEILEFCAATIGVTDEAQLATYAESLDKESFVQFNGTFAGRPAYAALKKTSADGQFDQCIDVNGCRVEFGAELSPDSVEQYRALALANYNLAMLGDLAAQLSDDTIPQGQFSILVNMQKPDKTTIYVAHTVKDAAALLASITETLQTSWYDEATASLGIDYAMQKAKYSFDTTNNVVHVEFSPNDNTVPAGEFKLSDVSLSKLGFQYFPQDGLAIYKEDKNHLEIAISKPEWHRTAEDWNFEFLGESNGCSLYMIYAEATGLFHVAVNKGDDGAAAEFNVPKNEFQSDVYPDEETQKRIFSEAAGIAEGDHREAVFALLADLIQDRFGLTWQEVYALPVW